MAESHEGQFYSTGELAEACGVTVRTVQYYDNKGLLSPTERSEGGRRLYTEADASRLRFILMLKSLGLGLAPIKGVLESPNRVTVLKMLLEERAASLRDELDEGARQLVALNSMMSDLEIFGKVMATTEPAMVARMRDEKARKRWFAAMVAIGVAMDVAWIGALVLGLLTGVWWPFPVALLAVAAMAVFVVRHYSAHSTYLCPECGTEFRSRLGEFFWSRHTSRTRKLTCPCCHAKDWCVERYRAEPIDIAPGTSVPGACRREPSAGEHSCL